MAVDALTPCVARSSAAIVLTRMINEPISSMGMDFNDLCHLRVQKLYKIQIYIQNQVNMSSSVPTGSSDAHVKSWINLISFGMIIKYLAVLGDNIAVILMTLILERALIHLIFPLHVISLIDWWIKTEHLLFQNNIFYIRKEVLWNQMPKLYLV